VYSVFLKHGFLSIYEAENADYGCSVIFGEKKLFLGWQKQKIIPPGRGKKAADF